MLWIALRLARLPLEIFSRGSPSPEPFAVAEGHRLLACDGKTLARGVRAGMPVPAALALAPRLVLRQRDPAAETEALLGTAGWAMQFTPNVALEFPDALLLEVSGSLKLFGGLAKILGDLREGLAAMGFTATLACAPTAHASAWLARAGEERLVTEPAQIEQAISVLPLPVLRNDEETLEALEGIGVARIGDLLCLPRGGLARRFGQGLLDDLDRALGHLADPRSFYAPPPKFHAAIELPAEITRAEALLFAANRLLAQLAGFLAAHCAGVQCAVVKLRHRDAGTTEISIALVAPTRDAEHIAILLRERLERLVLREPVRGIAVEAADLLPLAGDNLGLFSDETGAPGNWERLVERLRSRLGAEAVHGIGLRAEHRPEQASVPAEPDERQLKLEFGERPFWLLRSPHPIPEVSAVPHYQGPLTLLAGPERIESGWWDDEDISRDYFVARTKDDALVWIYRERHGAGRWYLHGLFA